MRICTIILVSVLLCLAGCAELRIGREYPKTHIQDIVVGRTTTEDLQKFFGAPFRKISRSDCEIWEYKFVNQNANFYSQLVIAVKDDKVFSYATTP
jgi:hypothetical protein